MNVSVSTTPKGHSHSRSIPLGPINLGRVHQPDTLKEPRIQKFKFGYANPNMMKYKDISIRMIFTSICLFLRSPSFFVGKPTKLPPDSSNRRHWSRLFNLSALGSEAVFSCLLTKKATPFLLQKSHIQVELQNCLYLRGIHYTRERLGPEICA